MHRLRWTNADEYAQNFYTGGSLSHRWIEAISTLLDGGHVEAGSIGNGLYMLLRVQVSIGSGNCRKLSFTQVRYRLRKFEIRVEIRVVIAATLASPPTCIQGQVHEVG